MGGSAGIVPTLCPESEVAECREEAGWGLRPVTLSSKERTDSHPTPSRLSDTCFNIDGPCPAHISERGSPKQKTRYCVTPLSEISRPGRARQRAGGRLQGLGQGLSGVKEGPAGDNDDSHTAPQMSRELLKDTL